MSAKQVGFEKFGYFKWWVMSDEWRKLNEEWKVMTKKKSKQPLNDQYKYKCS